MNKFKGFFVIQLFLVVCLSVNIGLKSCYAELVLTGSPQIDIKNSNAEILYEDSDGLDSILKKTNLFKTFNGTLQPNSSIWFRISLSNKTDIERWILLIDAVQYAQLFVPIAPNQYKCSEYGYSVPNQYKSIALPYYEAMPFSLAQQGRVVLYLHLKTGIEIYNHQCNLSVCGYDDCVSTQNYKNIVYGLFYGLLMMLFLISVVLAIGLQDVALSFYALFVGIFAFFLFTMQGFTATYILPWLGNVVLVAPIIGFIALQCFLLFFRNFIGLAHSKPRLDKRVLYWIVFSLFAILVLCVLLFVHPTAYFIAQRSLIIVNQLVCFFFLIPLFYFTNKETRLFLTGSLALLCGTVIYTLGTVLGVSNQKMLLAMQIGFFVQVIYLALGLMYRYRRIIEYKNEMQQALINELLDKDVVMQEQNMQLESIVTERTREVAQQNRELARINSKYEQGIHAAAVLQQNLFPAKEIIEKRFASSFVLWKPQQEIGGDFYWFYETQRGQMLLVVADCTGHGVPGALTAIMGRDFLEDVVVKQNEIWPDKILQQLNKRFIERFGGHSLGEVQFGMDISILLFDRQTRRAWFSGARQHLLIARGGVIDRVRGELLGIGDNKTLKQYCLHDFYLAPTDILYLYTDGFQHQLNANDLKKYGGKQLRKFLESIITLPLSEQRKQLEAEFQRWKGENGEQTDDILIVGCMLLRGKPDM